MEEAGAADHDPGARVPSSSRAEQSSGCELHPDTISSSGDSLDLVIVQKLTSVLRSFPWSVER
jgi:hypothetical protein